MKDFGALNGNPIRNKDTILQDINLSLGKSADSNPSVEYLITKPCGYIALP